MNRNKQTSRQPWSIVALALAGGCIGFLLARAGIVAAQSLPKSVVISLFISTVPLFFIAVAFHEAGHAWMGVRMGFDFRLFVVGPFLWERQDAGWHFKWNTNVNVGGGMALCVPRPGADLSRRFGWFVAGGPLGSLLLAIIAWIIFLVLDALQLTSVPGMFVTYLWPVLSILSAFLFVITLVPLHMGGFSSDGARLLRLSRGGDESQFDLLLVSYVSRSLAGMRPATFDTDELLKARDLGEKINAPTKLYINYYLFQAHFDRGAHEEAATYLQQYLDDADAIPEGMRGSAWLDAAFFFATTAKNLDKATYYWTQYKPSALIPKAMALATEAALAVLKAETEKALSLLDQAEEELPRMLDKGIANAMTERLGALRKKVLYQKKLLPN